MTNNNQTKKTLEFYRMNTVYYFILYLLHKMKINLTQYTHQFLIYKNLIITEDAECNTSK